MEHIFGPSTEEKLFLEGPQSRLKELRFAIKVFREFIRGFRALHFIGPSVTVFGSARFTEGHPFYALARQIGSKLPSLGLTVITGGGPGVMEAANRGAFDAGANSIGLNITLPHVQYPNPYITPDLCFRFRYFALRKLHFLLRARALVAFPGGYGTLDELFGTLTLVQTRAIRPVPIVLVGERYWRRAVDVNFLVDEGMIDREDQELFCYAETAPEIWNTILAWHRANGTPLFPAA